MHIIAAFRRRWWIVLIFAAIMTLLIHVALSYLPGMYSAGTVIWLDGRQSRIIANDSVWSAVQEADGGLSERSRILTSPPVLRRVVDALDLQNRPEIAAPPLAIAWHAFLADIAGIWLLGDDRGEDLDSPQPTAAPNDTASPGPGIKLAFAEAATSGERQPHRIRVVYTPDVFLGGPPVADASDESTSERRLQATAAALADTIKINFDRSTQLISVHVRSPDPESAAAIANAIPRAFAEEEAERMRHGTASAVRWLEERVEELRLEVVASEQRVDEHRAANGLLGITSDDARTNRLVELETRREEANFAAVAAAERLRSARESVASGSLDTRFFESTTLSNLLAMQAEATGRRAQLVAKVGLNHALVRAADGNLATLQGEILAEKRRLLAEIERDYEAALQLERSYSDRVGEEEGRLEQHVGATSAAVARLRELEREVSANKSLYEGFLARLKEAKQLDQMDAAGIRVISPALVPSGPSGLNPMLLLLIGSTGSLALGFFAVAGLSVVDRRIRHPDQLRDLGLDILAVAPRIDSSAESASNAVPGRRMRQSTRRQLVFDEAIRRLLSATVLATNGRAKRSILITSGSRGEGKSTVAHAVASSAAARGIRTVLIEADLRRTGRFATRLSHSDPGLRGALEGGVPVEQIMIADEATGLHVLPTNRTVQHSTELLASMQMRQIMRCLPEVYDFVVVDSSPICMTSDAEILAPLVDAVVLVVEQSVTRIDKTRTAIDLIQRVTEHPIGVFLNGCDGSAFHEYYGGGEYLYVASPPKRSAALKQFINARKLEPVRRNAG